MNKIKNSISTILKEYNVPIEKTVNGLMSLHFTPLAADKFEKDIGSLENRIASKTYLDLKENNEFCVEKVEKKQFVVNINQKYITNIDGQDIDYQMTGALVLAFGSQGYACFESNYGELDFYNNTLEVMNLIQKDSSFIVDDLGKGVFFIDSEECTEELLEEDLTIVAYENQSHLHPEEVDFDNTDQLLAGPSVSKKHEEASNVMNTFSYNPEN